MSISEKLTTIAENEQKVFDAGKQAERTRFFSSYQNNGKSGTAYMMFAGNGWNEETLTPLFDVKPTQAYMMFGYNKNYLDIVDIFEKAGKTLDFSSCSNFQYLLYYSNIVRFGVIDVRKATITQGICQYAQQLHTIEEIISSENVVWHSTAFAQTPALKEVRFSGVIATDIAFRYSPLLSKESILSVYNCASPTATFTMTFMLTAVNKAFETSEGTNDGSTSDEWKTLIANKPSGLTISLV